MHSYHGVVKQINERVHNEHFVRNNGTQPWWNVGHADFDDFLMVGIQSSTHWPFENIEIRKIAGDNFI